MHRDTTDLGPFSPILAAGSFVGGQLLLTQYGIALNIQPGAFALVNVHEVHCNLPMDEEEISNDSNQSMPRHSFVFYARKAVVDRCQADNQAALQQKNLDAIEIARARKEFEDRNAALAGFL